MIPRFLGSAVTALIALGLGACGNDAPAPELEPSTAKGYREVVVLEDGSLAPLLLNLGRTISLCYETDPAIDTSSWTLEILFDGLPAEGGPQPATDRSESTLCFQGAPPERWEGLLRAAEPAPEAEPVAVSTQICGRRVDTITSEVFDAGCVQAFVRPGDGYIALRKKRRRLLQSAWDQPLAELLPKIDALAQELDQQAFPQLAVNLKLTALHFLARDGSEQSVEQARKRLRQMPSWLGKRFSEHLAATVAYQEAIFLRRSGAEPAEVWKAFEKAEALYRQVALPTLSASHGMAQIVADAGAVREAQIRLRAALDECTPTPPETQSRCRPALESDARASLAWMILRDGGARISELRAAEASLLPTLEAAQDQDPLELANRRLDLAYLHLRLDENPIPALDAAHKLLQLGHAPKQTEQDHEQQLAEARNERSRYLSHWRTLILGLTAIRDDHPTEAIDYCLRLTETDDPLIAAWASSCQARAERLRGNLEAAAEAFDRALARHAFDWQRSRRLPLGLDQRADDFARAARLRIEMGEPARAWDLLLGLDHLSTTESARRQCRQGPLSDESRARWQELEREIADIYETLRSFDGPTSIGHRKDRDRMAHELKARLRELWRQWPGCQAPEPASDDGLEYRAFALDDEILLLRRLQDGSVRLVRRSPFDRIDLFNRLDRLTELAPNATDEQEWVRLTAPIAEALMPELPLAPAATFALHGSLQNVPMVALPLPPRDGSSSDRSSPEWLGQRMSIALQTAGAVSFGQQDARTPPLFVVDPSGNLVAASRQAEDYKKLFPEAEILKGNDATRDAVMPRLGSAEWIHFDTHGAFDAALPELSSLLLRQGPLHWLELTGLTPKARFVNLSGCQTGRWPVTADSGAYGIAGLFTRLGSPFALGSRGDLPDTVAAELNHAFYRAIQKGEKPDEAFRQGIEQVSSRFPAPQWSGLMLLRAASHPTPKIVVSNKNTGDSPQKFLSPKGQKPEPKTPSPSRPFAPGSFP